MSIPAAGDRLSGLSSQEAIQSVIEALRSRAFSLTDEVRMHAEIGQVFDDLGFLHEREHRLSRRDRIDFIFPAHGIGVECKLRQQKRAIFRQIERYAESEEIRTIILATNTVMGLPPDINGKPAFIVTLGSAWL